MKSLLDNGKATSLSLRYGKDYVYCNEYHEDEQFIQPLNSNGKPLCTIAKTNIISIRECK